MSKLVCIPASSLFINEAKRLSKLLHGEYREQKSKISIENENKNVMEVSTQLTLFMKLNSSEKPVQIFCDFVDSKTIFKLKHGDLSDSLLVKACSVAKRKNSDVQVVDGTAGMGSDLFTLAWSGFHVNACEENPLIYSLLENGLLRAADAKDPQIRAAASRIKLRNISSIDFLSNLAEKPDVIYLDPMYPHTNSTAQPKKGIQCLRLLTNVDSISQEKSEENVQNLVLAARKNTNNKVILKRPNSAKLEADIFHSYKGVKHRFDIFKPI